MLRKQLAGATVLLALLTACNSLKEAPPQATATLPLHWTEGADTTNRPPIRWREFFTDSLLIRLIEEGVRNNPDVLMALQKTEAVAATSQLSRSALLPSAGFNLSLAQRKFGLYTMDGAGNISTYITPGEIVPIHLPDYYAGLQTSWEVDVWGRLRNRRRAATARLLASFEGRNLVITTLVAQIANAWYELMALDNQLNVIRETIGLQQKALDLVTLQKQAATTTELAVMQFQAQLLNSQSLEYDVRQRIAEYENRINFLLGRYPQPVKRQSDRFRSLPALLPPLGKPSDLLIRRPDVRQSELELLATRADLKAARAAFYPALSLSGGIGYQAFRPSLLFTSPESIAYSALANLSAPLINRGAIKAVFRSANAAQVEAFYNYHKTVLNAYLEVNTTVKRINNLDSLVAIKARQLSVFRNSVDVSSELFRTNRATYLEVLMTQRNALETELELLDAHRRRYNAGIDLYKALGGGWN